MSLSQPIFTKSLKDKLISLPEDPTRPLEDDEETILDVSHNKVPYDETGVRVYERACHKLGVVPSSQYIRILSTSDTANLGHYGLGARGTMAICIPLVINMRITTLNLSHNHLGAKGMEHVRKMMADNDTITTLNVSHNNLGTEGTLEVAYLVRANSSLKNLDISGNGFDDKSVDMLLRGLEDNVKLIYLNLSENSFGESCGRSFLKFLSDNYVLERLDLSWNKIRRNAANLIAEGLKENRRLVSLNLSWNGFEDEGTMALGAALCNNDILKELNLSSNRVGPKGFLDLCRSFQTNDTLTSLKIGNNFITEDTVTLAMSYFKTLSQLPLKTLDITGVVISSTTTQEEIASVSDVHETFTCLYGYECCYGEPRKDFQETIDNILKMIMTYLELTNRSVADLFVEVDKDGSMSVSTSEFKEGLKKALIPITAYQLDELVLYLDKDNDGEVDFSEMVFMK